MNFLRLKSQVVEQFRRRYPQYWLDMLVEDVKRRCAIEGELIFGQVLVIKRHAHLDLELIIPGINIVTDAGDTYYAQSAVAGTPDDDFDGASSGLRLGSAVTSPTKSDTDVTTFLATSGHGLDATYPLTADADGDNTGAGADIVTWRYSYTTGEGNVSAIEEGAIVDDIVTPTAALTHFLFAATFSKTSSDTLKVFINHNFLGS